MYAKAIVRGRAVRFRLPEALARAHRRNAGRTMTAEQAIQFVEAKRRDLALSRAEPYRARYGSTRVMTPGGFVNLPSAQPLLRTLDHGES